MTVPRLRKIYFLLAPGILVAATGVGSGDLITAALGGSRLGLGIAWAAIAGSILKWVLNEGLARWQMGTDTTLLEGWTDHLGRWIRWLFLVYLLIWAFVCCGALASACGVAGHALLPITSNAADDKIIWGILHALAGILLVKLGGFRLFEKFMSVCIGLMFVTVILTAGLILASGAAIGEMARFSLPSDAEGRNLFVAILGGIGGTVTLLSYGYWIREQHRTGEAGVRTCRIDLAAGYAMTGLFGLAMILIGSRLHVPGSGDDMALILADQLVGVLGRFGGIGRWVFLVGFWGAVFSSLLGVWQSTPYLFTDFILLGRNHTAAERRSINYERTRAYQWSLLAIGLVPLVLLARPIKEVQLAYAVLGACFMPILALTLLILNNSRNLPARFRNGVVTNAMLVLTVAFFAYQGVLDLEKKLNPPSKETKSADTDEVRIPAPVRITSAAEIGQARDRQLAFESPSKCFNAVSIVAGPEIPSVLSNPAAPCSRAVFG